MRPTPLSVPSHLLFSAVQVKLGKVVSPSRRSKNMSDEEKRELESMGLISRDHAHAHMQTLQGLASGHVDFGGGGGGGGGGGDEETKEGGELAFRGDPAPTTRLASTDPPSTDLSSTVPPVHVLAQRLVVPNGFHAVTPPPESGGGDEGEGGEGGETGSMAGVGEKGAEGGAEEGDAAPSSGGQPGGAVGQKKGKVKAKAKGGKKNHGLTFTEMVDSSGGLHIYYNNPMTSGFAALKIDGPTSQVADLYRDVLRPLGWKPRTWIYVRSKQTHERGKHPHKLRRLELEGIESDGKETVITFRHKIQHLRQFTFPEYGREQLLEMTAESIEFGPYFLEELGSDAAQFNPHGNMGGHEPVKPPPEVSDGDALTVKVKLGLKF